MSGARVKARRQKQRGDGKGRSLGIVLEYITLCEANGSSRRPTFKRSSRIVFLVGPDLDRARDEASTRERARAKRAY